MRFKILNEDPWFDYKEANKVTEGLDVLKETMNWNRPKDEVDFWIKQIVANHSTLRCIKFRIFDEQPEVQSSRPDWNGGKERSSDPYELRLFMQDHTAESFVEMTKQRLCNRTEERTRLFMRELVNDLRHSDVPFFKALGYCCAPQCVWYSGCPEIKSCEMNKTKISSLIIDLKNKEEEKKND